MMAIVTTWADRGVEPDFTSGRWVQLGRANWLTFYLTGLPGGKVYTTRSFPFLRHEANKVDFSNHRTEDIDSSRLVFPWGFGVDGWIKGLLGQRRLA